MIPPLFMGHYWKRLISLGELLISYDEIIPRWFTFVPLYNVEREILRMKTIESALDKEPKFLDKNRNAT